MKPQIATTDCAPLDLSLCEAEPIRTPGIIQSYGCLLTLRAGDGVLTGFSANAPSMLGRELPVDAAIDELLGPDVWTQVQLALGDPQGAGEPRAVELGQVEEALQSG